MPEFSYIAMERTGIRKQGSLTASSEREAMALLDSRGLFPVNITLSKSASKGSFGWGRKIKSRFMAAFYAQLADLTGDTAAALKAYKQVVKLAPTDPAAKAAKQRIAVLSPAKHR